MRDFVVDSLSMGYLWRSGPNFGSLDYRQDFLFEKQKGDSDLVKNVSVLLL